MQCVHPVDSVKTDIFFDIYIRKDTKAASFIMPEAFLKLGINLNSIIKDFSILSIGDLCFLIVN